MECVVSKKNAIENPIQVDSYRELPPKMFMEADPDAALAPTLIELNSALLNEMGVSEQWFGSDQGLAAMSGQLEAGEHAPIAMAYSGHQFGHWSTLLGDGRAHLLGQIRTVGGALVDVQLKGSGRTPFSRGGDGRATLGSVLREYVVSEAMAGLGISTTRSIAVVATGEYVRREQAMPGAILVRAAASHLRVGSFQYANSVLGTDGVRALADFTLRNYFSEIDSGPLRYLDLFTAIARRQALLIAQWMQVGFIHGVMNTDNVSIVGETIDYGPCAFMDEFQSDKVFSSIDVNGRYAWDQQPGIGHWNLTQLAQTLLPLFHAVPETARAMAEESLQIYATTFHHAFQGAMCQKLGMEPDAAGAPEFVASTLSNMEEQDIDFTLFFDNLTEVAAGSEDDRLLTLFSDSQSATDWLEKWRSLTPSGLNVAGSMRTFNPAVIARNHRVEEAILAATNEGDFELFRRLCRVLAKPFELSVEDSDLAVAPLRAERVTQTFCGT
ncbi:MAG: hypothetical protein ACI9B9_002008 [Halioglobus sp.]|jgi:uncharacterized protein YdiU (UPF0061 family)